MKKKRMRKVVRNDNDEHEEYEKDYIEIFDESSSKIKFVILAAILACVGYCYFGGASYRQSTEDTTNEASKDAREAKRRANNQTDSKAATKSGPTKPTATGPHPPPKQDFSADESASPKKQESAETEQQVSRDDKGKKKGGKKK